MKKKLICAACAVLAAAITFCGCSSATVRINDGKTETEREFTPVSGEFIVKNGKSDYIIVTENDPEGGAKSFISSPV